MEILQQVIALFLSVSIVNSSSNTSLPCTSLLVGQYQCPPPTIDPKTQEPVGCLPNGTAKQECFPLKGIHCDGRVFNGSQGFSKDIKCRYTNGYYYTTAVGLSVFLGWLGIDRFYLGYPALGLLKLCSFGVFGIGAFFDFMLIALQVVIPADGSDYIIDFYGPRIDHMSINNETYYVPQVE